MSHRRLRRLATLAAFVPAAAVLVSLAVPARKAVSAPALVPCTAGSSWSPGTQAFEDRTGEWFDGLLVEGIRLNVADLEGDGRPDLIVRRGGTGPDEYFKDGIRRTWVLQNRDGHFRDVTRSSRWSRFRGDAPDATGRPGEVVASGDVDNDGDADLYAGVSTVSASAHLGETSEILLNDGGRFSFGPEDSEVRRADDRDTPASASFVDVDRDGNLDLWIPMHDYSLGSGFYIVQDRLFRGDGSGSFEEMTFDAGLETELWTDIATLNSGFAHTRAWSGNACDLNGDGTPELLAGSYGRSPNHLWQGARDGGGNVTFTNRSVASGYAYDADRTWEDNQFALCYCEANPAAEGCAGLPQPDIVCSTPNWNHEQDREAFRLGGNSAASVCSDLDNDGDLDVLTTEIKHWWAGAGSDGAEILLNTSTSAAVSLVRPGRAATGLEIPHAGISWDEGIMTASVFDFDNDGWPDIYLGGSDYPGNRGLLFHQASPGVWEEVPVGDGIDHNRSHGVVTADFDRDGDLDVIAGHSFARCGAPNDCYDTQQVRFFENVLGDTGNWLQLELEGAPGTNRSAIGARVTVTADGVTQTQEVGGGGGHFGAQNDLALHFGLGSACEAQVTIRWPDAALSEQSLTLAGGGRYRVVQGEEPVLSPPGKLSGGGDDAPFLSCAVGSAGGGARGAALSAILMALACCAWSRRRTRRGSERATTRVSWPRSVPRSRTGRLTPRSAARRRTA